MPAGWAPASPAWSSTSEYAELLRQPSAFGANNVLTATGNLIVGVPAGGNAWCRGPPVCDLWCGRSRPNGSQWTARLLDLCARSATRTLASTEGVGLMGFLSQHVGLRGDVRYFRNFRESARHGAVRRVPFLARVDRHHVAAVSGPTVGRKGHTSHQAAAEAASYKDAVNDDERPAELASCLLLTALPTVEPLRSVSLHGGAFEPPISSSLRSSRPDRDNSLNNRRVGRFFSEQRNRAGRRPAAGPARFEFRSLPSGTYQVSAVLKGTRGRRATMRQVNVVAGEPREFKEGSQDHVEGISTVCLARQRS